MIDIHLYGRRRYENIAADWQTAGENPAATQAGREYARIWKDMQKIVFSRSLKQVRWNSRLVSGDIAAEVNFLKAQPGEWLEKWRLKQVRLEL